MPSETFTHQATTSASIVEVWTALEHPETWETIGGVDRVLDPVIDDNGRLRGFSFETIAAGKKYVGTATPHERVEGRKMAWRIENSEVRGLTTVTLEPDDADTKVTVTLRVESAGLLSTIFFPVIAGAIGNALPKAVEEFATGLEAR